MNAMLKPVPERIQGPSNIEVEQAVIGLILTNNRAYYEVSRFMQPDYFSERLHQNIWRVASEMIEAGNLVSPITIKTYLPSDAQIGSMSLNQYMALLAGAACIPMNLIGMAREIVKTYLMRRCIAACEDGIGDCVTPQHDVSVSSILDSISTEISELHAIADRQSGNASMTLLEGLNSAIDDTAGAYKGEKVAGYDTGLGFINSLTGPWIPGQYIIIGAATKIGKSALAMQTALAIAQQAPVLYFSFEMKAKLLAARQLASLTKIGTLRQRRGDIADHEFEKLVKAAGDIAGAENLHIISRKHDIHQIFETARNFKRRFGKLGAVFVDHLGIMGKPKEIRSNSDWELAAHGSPIMKDIAEELDCVAVGLSQLNKENPAFGITRKNDVDTIRAKIAACLVKPNAGQLKGSIANDADHVIMPFRGEAMISKIEPPEGSEAHMVWEDAMRDQRDKADITLALSREVQWPKTREVKWDGPATVFLDREDQKDWTR